jgi:hypothetical protein
MNIIVRAFVVALAITGAAATASVNNSSASTKPVVTRPSAYPIPSCVPGDYSCANNTNTGY